MSGTKKTKSFDLKILKRVFTFVRPYRSKFFTSLFLSLLLAIISPIRGLLVQYMVDKGIKNGQSKIPAWLNGFFEHISGHDIVLFLIWVAGFQILLLLIETVVRFSFTFLTSWLGQNVIKDLRLTVYQKVLGLNLKQFDTTPIGTLTTRTINDIESINDIFSDGLIPIVADLLTIFFTLGTMLWVDVKLTLIALIPFPILLIATYYFKEAVNKSFIRVRNAVAALNAFVQEHLMGMQVVQAFAAEHREMGKFKAINKDHRNANIAAIFAYSVFFPVVEIVLAISTGLIVWWVAHEKISAVTGENIGAGKLIAFILFLNQIFRPLRVIADKFNVIQMGMVSSERVFKVLDNPDEMPNTGTIEKKIIGKLKFEQVWFAYTDANWVLKNVNFEIKPGETLAIVGSTGSGKTTIISLLNRLYQIQKGSIKMDDIDIENYSLHSLRSQVGIVLQDVFLFSGSIYDNCTLRNDAIKKQQVIEAAKMIGVHDFIMQLPGGYDYNVMERGATLSVGQRQLISFIRCLLYNPAILVLDEATSSIDTESEQLIQQAIDKLIAGRTSIVIAHRLSTIRKASNILVLDKGEVKEMGTHDELLALGGAYSKLHEMQFGNKLSEKIAN